MSLTIICSIDNPNILIESLVGWQPRWFVLEVGVLAYYKSQEEVGLGSRGSVKMACCEISGN